MAFGMAIRDEFRQLKCLLVGTGNRRNSMINERVCGYQMGIAKALRVQGCMRDVGFASLALDSPVELCEVMLLHYGIVPSQSLP